MTMELTHILHTDTDVYPAEIPRGDHERFGFRPTYEGRVANHISITRPEDDNEESWRSVSEMAERAGKPILVVGGRTNMYPTEQGFDGIMVSYHTSVAENAPNLTPNPETGLVVCPASIPLGHFVRQMSLNHQRKVGNLTGVPGTLGAAVVGNSGRTVTRNNVGDMVRGIRAYDLQEKRPVDIDIDPEFFGQRSSRLRQINFPSTRYVVQEVVMDVGTKKDPSAIDLYEKRWHEREGANGKNHEGVGTAGSIFVNGTVPEGATIPEELVKEGRQVLVRYLLQNAKLPDGSSLVELNIEGARFSKPHSFLQVGPNTRDRHVAELLKTTVDTMQRQYGFVPRLEINLLGRQGFLSLDQFISYHDKTSTLNPAQSDVSITA